MSRKPSYMEGVKEEYRIVLNIDGRALAHLKFTGELTIDLSMGDKRETKGKLRLSNSQLIQAYNNRMSLREIAMMTGWSPPTVQRRMQALGLDTSTYPKDRTEVDEDDIDTDVLWPTGRQEKWGRRNRAAKAKINEDSESPSEAKPMTSEERRAALSHIPEARREELLREFGL